MSAAWAKAHGFLNRGGLRPGCWSHADDACARMVGVGSQPVRCPAFLPNVGRRPRLQVGMGMEPASTDHFSRLFTPSYQAGKER